jgi:hypothetical protein
VSFCLASVPAGPLGREAPWPNKANSPSGAGVSRTNKANLPGRGLGDAGRGSSCKQSQSGVRSREEACRREQTKPTGRSESRQTNPIWGSPRGVRRPILPNKANSGSRPGVPRAKCAKQSQTWAGWGIWGRARHGSVQTNPIRSGQMRQTNPIGRLRIGDSLAACRLGRGKCAKQTQFAATPVCTNKPNSRLRRAGRGPRRRGTRDKCAKRSQSVNRGSRIGGTPGAWCLGAGERNAPNKPNFGHREPHYSNIPLFQCSSPQARDEGAKCAKQTQF